MRSIAVLYIICHIRLSIYLRRDLMHTVVVFCTEIIHEIYLLFAWELRQSQRHMLIAAMRVG